MRPCSNEEDYHLDYVGIVYDDPEIEYNLHMMRAWIGIIMTPECGFKVRGGAIDALIGFESVAVPTRTPGQILERAATHGALRRAEEYIPRVLSRS